MLAGIAPIPALAARGSAQQAPLVFQGVTVVDVRSGRLQPARTVVVADRRVRAIGVMGKVRVPRGAQVVNAQGKYLIPGLWDMHYHVNASPDTSYPFLIANGITGIRDPGSVVPIDTVRRWRQEITAGQRVGPRQPLIMGPMFQDDVAGKLGGRASLAIKTPADARRIIDSLKEAGAEFLKTHYTLSATVSTDGWPANFIPGGDKDLTREVYFAILAEARRVSLPVAGHVPAILTLLEASDSGQSTFEHVWWLMANHQLRGTCEGDSASVAKCAVLAKRLRRNKTWLVPTVAYHRYMTNRDNQRRPPLLSALPYFSDSSRRAVPGTDDTEEFSKLKAPFVIMARAGMPILAGTDGHWGLPRYAIHEELATLVELGLTPLAALQAATLNPTTYLGVADLIGTIAPGKIADLVLLDANPLADIRNTAAIRAVVANGRYFDRAALDGLLADVNRMVQDGTH